MQLTEQYRPRRLEDVIGQEKIVAKIRAIAKRGLAGRAYWLSGVSGVGKTTLAKIIAAEIATDLFIFELDAAALTVSDLQQIESDMRCRGWGDKQGKAYLINEAHALRKPVITHLLVMLERLPAHVAMIFTTTVEGADKFEDYQDGPALISRCTKLPLAKRDLAQAFAMRAKEIAAIEQLDGRPIRDYVRLVQSCHQNFRAVLNAVEAGDMLLPEDSSNVASESGED